MNEKAISLEQLSNCGTRAQAYTAAVATAAASTLQAMDTVKADKPNMVSATLPTAGWVEDVNDTSGYSYRYDLTAAGVTADNIAHVIVPYSSQRAAIACGLCPSNETLAGAIRFRAATLPANAIAVEYWLEAQSNTV